MPYRTDIVYRYDGSYNGMMCCIFESFDKRESPAAILGPDASQLTLFEERFIETDVIKAERVIRSVPNKISQKAMEMIDNAFLSCLREKELTILRFLRLGYKAGPSVVYMLADPAVNALNTAILHLNQEAHLLSGFIRFSDYRGILTASIDPKNRVLPVLTQHFCDRYQSETFLIHDKTHGEALVSANGVGRILPLQHLSLPETTEEERMYRNLWKRFYATIAIEGRINPGLRMSHMPKRYWHNMTEFSEQTGDASAGKYLP